VRARRVRPSSTVSDCWEVKRCDGLSMATYRVATHVRKEDVKVRDIR